MSRKPDYALDEPMQVNNPHGKSIDFQHNGRLHVLPMGVSSWPFEVAERLERKYGVLGVRITFGAPVVVPVAESTPAPVVEQPLDDPASTDVETPAEPDPPAEPKEP